MSLSLPQSHGPFLGFEIMPLLYTHPSTARPAFDELTESSKHRGGVRHSNGTLRDASQLTCWSLER
jgi:hypothetical protein